MNIIAHLDMDAFFAAIEERDHPALRGLPLVVGANPREGKGRGVVSTANYAARAYGIRSAMPIAQAWRRSEAAKRQGKAPVVFLPVDMENYARTSARIMAIVRRFAPLVEQASIDEAYIDLTFAGSFSEAERICRAMARQIEAEEHLTASIGIGPNKLIAKIASGRHKPRGVTVVTPQEADAFLAALPIRSIPGIGPKTEALLAAHHIERVSDLRSWSREACRALLGKRGDELYEKIRGIDDTPVFQTHIVKSVGEQETFDTDTLAPHRLLERLSTMCEHVIARLKDEGFNRFRTVVLTVRFADFETKTRSRTLAAPASTARALQAEAIRLFLPFLDRRENPHRKRIRLLGVRIDNLC